MGTVQWFDGGAWQMPWLVRGGGPGPTVVAVPGLSDGLGPLSRVQPALPRPGGLQARLVALSHRHPLPPGTTTRQLADDLATFLDRAFAEPVVLAGHSMGGMVAQWVAATRPELLSHLVLTATAARPDDGMRQVLGEWAELVRAHRWRAFAEAADRASWTGSELLRRRLLLRLTRPRAAPDLVERHLALTEACLGHDTSDWLSRIRVPTLVLAGEADPVVSTASSRALADGIRGAQLQVLAGLAHGFPEQARGRTLALLAGHLEATG